MLEFAQILFGGLVQGVIYAMIAVGFSFTYRITGVVNLAQGGFCLLGALLSFAAERWWGLPTWLAVPLAVLISTAFAAVVAAVVFVPGTRKLPPGSMLMLSAGLLTAIEGLVIVLWGSQPYSLPSFSSERPWAIGDFLIPTQAVWIAGVSLITLAGLTLLLRSRYGRTLLATAENYTAARLMGIDVGRVMLTSFVLSAGIGALAGSVFAPAASLQFDSGRAFAISGFVAVAIGGIGTLPGAVVGGLLLGVLNQLGTAYVSSLFSSALTLLLLLLILIFRPEGILGKGEARRQDVRDEVRVHRKTLRIPEGDRNVALATVLAILLLLPAVLPPGGILPSVTIALILYITLMGLDLLTGYTGQISLGQAGFMALGGYTAAIASTRFGLPPVAGIVIGLLVSMVFAAILAVITLRLRGLYLALATLAFGLLVDSGTIGGEGLTGGPSGLSGVPPFSIGGFNFVGPVSMYYLVLGVVVVVFLLLSGIIRSRFGRALSAIRTDQLAASALGIDVVRTKIAVFVLAACLASLAGSLYAYNFRFLSPDMVGSSRSLELISMLVIGGEGTLFGPLLGALLLTLLPTLFQPFAAYKTLLAGGLLVAVFLYSPRGLIGLLAPLVTNRRISDAPPVSRTPSDGVPPEENA